MMRSQKRVRNNPGLAVQFSFTSIFTSGVAGITQYVGMGDQNDGYFFGYQGTNFGILRRDGGNSHVQRITLSGTTNAGTGADVTLNSDTVNIPVANGSAADLVVRTIANATQTFLDLGEGWTVSALNTTLTFVSTTDGLKSGSYSISATAGITTTSNVTAVTGANATETFINQTDWNVDPADGSGDLPALDWTKGNVFRISYQWLGFGMITFSVEKPSTGALKPVHRIQYAGTSVTASIAAPNQPYAAIVTRTSAASPVSISLPSGGAFVSGNYNPNFGPRYGVSGSFSGTLDTAIHLLSIYNDLAFNSISTLNRSDCRVLALTVFADLENNTKEFAIFTIFRNAQQTLTPDPVTWSSLSPYSLVQYNVTNNARVSGIGEQLAQFVIAFASNTYIDGIPLDIVIPPGDTISIYAAGSGSVSNATASVGLSWVERL